MLWIVVRELALERALIGDLLLEVARAELLLVEQREALLLTAAEQAGGRERDACLRRLVGLDRERGAVVLQLVGDSLGVQRARDLARLGGVETRHQGRVARRRGHLEDQNQEHDSDGGGDADHRPPAR